MRIIKKNNIHDEYGALINEADLDLWISENVIEAATKLTLLGHPEAGTNSNILSQGIILTLLRFINRNYNLLTPHAYRLGMRMLYNQISKVDGFKDSVLIKKIKKKIDKYNSLPKIMGRGRSMINDEIVTYITNKLMKHDNQIKEFQEQYNPNIENYEETKNIIKVLSPKLGSMLKFDYDEFLDIRSEQVHYWVSGNSRKTKNEICDGLNKLRDIMIEKNLNTCLVLKSRILKKKNKAEKYLKAEKKADAEKAAKKAAAKKASAKKVAAEKAAAEKTAALKATAEKKADSEKAAADKKAAAEKVATAEKLALFTKVSKQSKKLVQNFFKNKGGG
ncbi:hypothetical protein CPAV1605_853 [seawater metagenome]|uniref:Uncharacterized protein n=1 Tax=seawater metagenome TaxID=1561972 RepID=A0A5E8CID5_9ZZZZ